jgi:hypothetical protein
MIIWNHYKKIIKERDAKCQIELKYLEERSEERDVILQIELEAMLDKKIVQQHRYSNIGRIPSVTTHIIRSKINTLMFSRGKTPTGKHAQCQPTRPLGAVY